MAKDLQARGVAVVAISSNDVANFPDDSPEKMSDEAQRADFTFPATVKVLRKVALSLSLAGCSVQIHCGVASNGMVAKATTNEQARLADNRERFTKMVGWGRGA